jgi:Predicted membrane protein (DUF2232)
MVLLMVLAGFLLVPSTPLLQSVAPVPNTALLLVPAIGVCAALGWALGGRAWLAAVWVALAAAIVLWGGPAHSTYTALQCGWALVLVASFGLVCAASPWTTRFLARALTALALSVALVGVLALGTRNASAAVRQAVRINATSRPNAALAWVQQTAGSPEWRDWTASSREGTAFATAEQALDNVLSTLPLDAIAFYPALLALESLVALALAWAIYHRISRTRIGQPMGRLADFRFSDQLAWGLIAGALLILLPRPGDWPALGLNLLLFFGALYALRGLAVFVWYLHAMRASAPALLALALIAALLSAPTAIGLALIGLSDSWADWRSRSRPVAP